MNCRTFLSTFCRTYLAFFLVLSAAPLVGAYCQAIFSDDFESFSCNSFPTSGGWSIITNGYGSSEQYTDCDVAYSGTKSFHLSGATNWSAIIHNNLPTMAPVMRMTAKMRVAQVDCTPYCIPGYGIGGFGLRNGTDPWGYPEFAVNFGVLENGAPAVWDGATPIELNYDQWYTLAVEVNTIAKTYSRWLGGQELGSPVSYEGSPDPTGMALVSGGMGHTKTWFDDVHVTEEFISDSFCDDFEDGNGWQSRWAVGHGYPTLVGSPTHGGSGALQMVQQQTGVDCHSSVFRRGFAANSGTYSAWFRQEYWNSGFELDIQSDRLDGDQFSGTCYRFGFSASGFWLHKNVAGAAVILIPSTPVAFAMNEWVKAFVVRSPGGVIIAGYEQTNGFRDSLVYVDPDPIEAPGAFYLWTCSDWGYYNYYDDACYNPLDEPADTLLVGQPNCVVSYDHNNAWVPVYLHNQDTLKAGDIPLVVDWPFAPDSVSFVGTRLANCDSQVGQVDASGDTIRIGFVCDIHGGGKVLLPATDATKDIPIAKIYFGWPYACATEMVSPPDTCRIILAGGNVQRFKLVDNYNVDIVPALVRDSTKVLLYKPGDCTGDDNVDISDAVCVISYIFSGGTPSCLVASDCNGDGSVDISDAVYLIAYIFSGGSLPGSSLLCGYIAPFGKAGIESANLVASASSNEVAVTSSNVESLAGLQLSFSVPDNIQITSVQTNIEGMDVFSGMVDGKFRVGLIDMTGKTTIPAGTHDVVSIVYQGNGIIELKEGIVVGEDASKMNVIISNKGVTEQNGGSSALPKAYSLSQNVPNPFNPTTEIAYSIPIAVQVKIEVLNILGQSVRTLVDEFKVAGNYSVVWDGRDNSQQSVASGIYLYRLTAGEYGETRKMVLMK